MYESLFLHVLSNIYLHILANLVDKFLLIHLPFKFLLLRPNQNLVFFPKSCLHILDINPMSVVGPVTIQPRVPKIYVCGPRVKYWKAMNKGVELTLPDFKT